ncbi:MAG: phytoene desaturase family protein [Acidobacteriota bacterium]
MSESYDVVVVGAGHNGLVSAAYLAKAGRKVLVVERREVPGGTTVTEEFAPGFKASAGPDLCGLLLPQVVQDLDLRRHGLELLELDPAVFAPLPGGKHLTLWRDRKKTLGEIERHSRADAEAYPRFADLISHVASFLRPTLSRPAPVPEVRNAADLLNLLKLGWRFRQLGSRYMHEALRVLPMSASDFLNEWFETEVLKACLAAPGLYGVSLGPRSAGTTALFLYHQLGEPGWPLLASRLPRSGMGSVSRAIARAAEGYGAHFRTGAPVLQILVENGRATGVVLDGGEEISAERVVSNADPRTTFLKLVDPSELEPRFLSDVRAIRYRGVMAKLMLALGELPDFTSLPGKDAAAQHRGLIHIGPDLDYLERAYDDAKYGRPSARPFLQAVIPSLADPTLAPPGKHVMAVTMQYAPYHLREGSWKQRGGALADAIVATLSEYAPNLRNAVLHRKLLTPLDYEETYGSPEGSLHHGELALDQLFFMRPVAGWARYRTPIHGLYLCGSGTHPGGGVSGACGYNAGRQILRDWNEL